MKPNVKYYSPVRSTYVRLANNTMAFCVLADIHDWRKQAKEFCNKHNVAYVYLPDRRYLHLDDKHPDGISYSSEPYDFKAESIGYYFHYVWKKAYIVGN